MPFANETAVSFTGYDGLRLYGAYRQPTDAIRAAMVLVHPITADRGFYEDEAGFLVQHGVATLRFDFRCHGVDQTPFQELSLSGIVNDIDAAFSHLETLTGDQVQHSYLLGVSYSGGVAAYWAFHNAARLSRLFLWAPVLDYDADLRHDIGDWVKLLQQDGYIKYFGGRRLGRPLVNEMKYINGMQALSSPKVPVTIFHGDKDDNVPIASSQRYCKPAGECNLFVVKGGGHMLDVPGDDEQTKMNQQSILVEIVRNIDLDVVGS